MTKASQLQDLDRAYERFVDLVSSLTPGQFLRSVGAWAPRDIVAHLIGWTRNIRAGCDQIMQGTTPFYHVDAANDYRTINAEFMARYNSTDSEVLLHELAEGNGALRLYFEAVDELNWSRDFGPQHYRGGPATVSRCAESITREYREHAREISAGI